MSTGPVPAYSPVWHRALARAVDELSTETYEISGLALMETAGRGVAEIVEKLAEAEHRDVLVLVGRGNNGGDAAVAARHLEGAGFAVRIFLVGYDEGPTARPASESNVAQLRTAKAIGIPVQPWRPGALVAAAAGGTPIIVDGVLGLGFRGPLVPGSPVYAALAEAATLAGEVFAVDLPSGLDCDSGEAQDVPLAADVTVTFGARKPAHVLAPARDVCGHVVCLEIGFPPAAATAARAVHGLVFVEPDAKSIIRVSPWDELAPSANKYDRGHVLVIGGSPGKTGAPMLAGLAALRSGAGWATLAMPDAALLTMAGETPPELTFEALFDGNEVNAINLERFLTERKVRAVVVGPGSMTSPVTPEVFGVLENFTKDGGFVVLDAGATHGAYALLASAPGDAAQWLLTPHPGEWRRMGPEFDFAPLDPTGVTRARKLAREMGATLVYKGATPVVIAGALAAEPAYVVTEGSSTLARAGSGDVLAGVAGAHGAAGLDAVTTALRSQIAIAWAATLAAETHGEHAVLATDVLASLGKVTQLFDV